MSQQREQVEHTHSVSLDLSRPVELIAHGREMSFTEKNASSLITDRVKLGTLRSDKGKYDFLPGEEVMAVCADGKRIPIVVINLQRKPLAQMDELPLIFDGYFSRQEAFSDLQANFYPDMTMETMMKYIAFVPKDYFQELPAKTQRTLIEDQPEELMKKLEFRPLFFPAICQWLVWKKYANCEEWLKFLEERGLATNEDVRRIREDGYAYRFINNLFNTPFGMQGLLDNSTVRGKPNLNYQRFILLQPLN